MSFFLFLSFRNSIYFSDRKILYLFIFFIFLIITSLGLFQKKIIFLNLFFLIIFNLLITPIFFNFTFDVPYRHPNSNKSIFWEKNYQKGFEFEKHTISTDIKGNRVNKKIDYLNKDKNTLRIFTVGASTTENEGLDDSLTWSNQLIKKLKIKNYLEKKIMK